MNACLMNKKAGHFPKIGLSVQIGIFLPSISHPATEIHIMKISYLPCFQQFFDFSMPGLETVIFMNHKPDSLLASCLYYFQCIPIFRSQGFLANGIKFLFSNVSAYFQMAIWRGNDIHKIRLFLLKHFLIIRVDLRYVEFLGHVQSLFTVQVKK